MLFTNQPLIVQNKKDKPNWKNKKKEEAGDEYRLSCVE